MSEYNKTQCKQNSVTLSEWETGLHLVQLLNLVIPIGGLIGAAAIWKAKGGESDKIQKQGKDVLNFQITAVSFSLVVGLLKTLAFSAFLPEAALTLTSILLVFAVVIQVYFPIISVIRLNEGKEPCYPIVHNFFN